MSVSATASRDGVLAKRRRIVLLDGIEGGRLRELVCVSVHHINGGAAVAAADYKKSSVENGWMKGAKGGRDHREVHRSLLWSGGGGGSSKNESTRPICCSFLMQFDDILLFYIAISGS